MRRVTRYPGRRSLCLEQFAAIAIHGHAIFVVIGHHWECSAAWAVAKRGESRNFGSAPMSSDNIFYNYRLIYWRRQSCSNAVKLNCVLCKGGAHETRQNQPLWPEYGWPRVHPPRYCRVLLSTPHSEEHGVRSSVLQSERSCNGNRNGRTLKVCGPLTSRCLRAFFLITPDFPGKDGRDLTRPYSPPAPTGCRLCRHILVRTNAATPGRGVDRIDTRQRHWNGSETGRLGGGMRT